MAGMIDPRLRQMVPGMAAPPGPVPTQQIGPTGFRSPGAPSIPNPQQPQGMNPLALLGMANAMKGMGGKLDPSTMAMSPSSYNGVIEGMTGADAQKYLAGAIANPSNPGGGFMNWFRGLF